MLTKSLLPAAVALALAGGAFAADEKPARAKGAQQGQAGSAAAGGGVPHPKSFEALDIDGDGRLSKLEISALPALETNFQKADRNNDLQLSREEYENLVPVPVTPSGGPGPGRVDRR